MYMCVSLSLSLYIYIYTHTYVDMYAHNSIVIIITAPSAGSFASGSRPLSSRMQPGPETRAGLTYVMPILVLRYAVLCCAMI